mmetsp:Transcript_10059/g.14511  ORF Transcript_10059/g.14511 Transcript_10059/m.14511 type:complete len:165 (-) Transcript_10059:1409-1903(-)
MEAFELLLNKFEDILEIIPAADRRSLSWRTLQEQFLQVKEAFEKICIVVAEWKSAPASTGALLKTIEAKVQTDIQAIESIAKAVMDMTEMTNVLVVKTDFSGHGADGADEAGTVTAELTTVNPDAAFKSQSSLKTLAFNAISGMNSWITHNVMVFICASGLCGT